MSGAQMSVNCVSLNSRPFSMVKINRFIKDRINRLSGNPTFDDSEFDASEFLGQQGTRLALDFAISREAKFMNRFRISRN